MVGDTRNKTNFPTRKRFIRRFVATFGRLFLSIAFGILALATGLIIWAYHEFESDLPTNLNAVTDYSPLRASQVLSADGETIGEFFVEKRTLVPIENVPEVVRRAFIAAEDVRFFDHGGIDYLGIARAAWANLRAGSVIQGGSTITQQVAKLLLLSKERSLARKIREALLAHRIEKRLSKKQILGIYLNHVYLGHGAYGIGSAASAYFGKNVEDLSPGEAAMLAAMPKAPGRSTPFADFNRAKARQLYVIGQMESLGFLNAAESTTAREEALVLVSRGRSLRNVAAPYFVEEIRKRIADDFGDEDLLRDGLRIQTTLDMRLQRAGEAAVRGGLEEIERGLGFQGPLATLAGAALQSFLTGLPRPHGPNGFDPDDPEQQGYLLTSPVVDPPAAEGETDIIDATQPGATLPEKTARQLANRAGMRRKKPVATPIPVPAPDPDTPYVAAITTLTSDRLEVGSGALRALIEPGAARELRSFATGDGRKLRLGDLIAVQFAANPEHANQWLARPATRPTVQAALVAIDPHTGHLLAMVGGYDYESSQFNRATQARRQIGSAIKPFIYAAAIQKGLTPLTIRWDVPVRFRTASGIWAPHNYRPEYLGRMTLRTALEKSINTVAAQLTAELGVVRVIDLMRKSGIQSKLPHQLSLALGTADLSPFELAYGIASFPAGGKHVAPISILRILDGERNPLKIEPPSRPAGMDRVVDPEVAYIITHMMEAVAESGTAKKAKALGRPVAGKTGTSTGFRDAWFVGFTPELLCIVWVGRDDFTPIGHDMTGGKTALPIWMQFMTEALKGRPVQDFKPPANTLFVRADPETGMPALPSDRKSRLIPFRRGTLTPAFRRPDADARFNAEAF
jgi:penicillin-binding protein 1A